MNVTEHGFSLGNPWLLADFGEVLEADFFNLLNALPWNYNGISTYSIYFVKIKPQILRRNMTE